MFAENPFEKVPLFSGFPETEVFEEDEVEIAPAEFSNIFNVGFDFAKENSPPTRRKKSNPFAMLAYFIEPGRNTGFSDDFEVKKIEPTDEDEYVEIFEVKDLKNTEPKLNSNSHENVNLNEEATPSTTKETDLLENVFSGLESIASLASLPDFPDSTNMTTNDEHYFDFGSSKFPNKGIDPDELPNFNEETFACELFPELCADEPEKLLPANRNVSKRKCIEQEETPNKKRRFSIPTEGLAPLLIKRSSTRKRTKIFKENRRAQSNKKTGL